MEKKTWSQAALEAWHNGPGTETIHCGDFQATGLEEATQFAT